VETEADKLEYEEEDLPGCNAMKLKDNQVF
jgi:hypothetical protein